MREILFRGQIRKCGEKVSLNGEKLPGRWVYGGIFQGTGDFSVIYGAEKEDFTGADLGKYPVYSETVGQFTGLTDKNGKRIFEGDICRVGNLIYKVEFKYSCWWFTILSSKVYCCPAFNSHCGDLCEVIGNVHDNPEVLHG